MSSERLSKSPPLVQELRDLCNQQATKDAYPLADAIEENVPIYSGLKVLSSSGDIRSDFQDEWYQCLLKGPGVFVIRQMFPSMALLDTTNSVYHKIIASEKVKGAGGDHFSKGTNNRIWNSFQKHALIDGPSFYQYYSNPLLSLVSAAWLGPWYRITGQVNVVNPGGAAQQPHRDYHFGFQTADRAQQFPLAMHTASQFLTLQGAVAHTDMPVESGPTKLLPFSQAFEKGYLAYRLPEFVDYFEANYVQLPLQKGDGIFFNPALFHAAGENRTEDFARSANLLQISSAFGKPMEMVDSVAIILALWDLLLEKHRTSGACSNGESEMGDEMDGDAGESLPEELLCIVKAIAEGYPFPTNLDKVPPRHDGMAPESEQEFVLKALAGRWGKEKLIEGLGRRAKQSAA